MNMIPAASDPLVGFRGYFVSLVFNIAMFGGLAYGTYAVARWLAG